MDVTALADELVRTDAERRSLAELRAATGEADGVMERHCARCFLICERLAAAYRTELDREAMLCAALLHDIGLYPTVSAGGIYTEEGADLARRVGREAGWDDARIELCATACERHHKLSPQIEHGAEVEFLRLADRVEVSGVLRAGLNRGELAEINAAAPRDGFYAGLVKLVWPVLRDRPATLIHVFGG